MNLSNGFLQTTEKELKVFRGALWPLMKSYSIMAQTEVAPHSISGHFLMHIIDLASQPLTLNKGLPSSYLKINK